MENKQTNKKSRQLLKEEISTFEELCNIGSNFVVSEFLDMAGIDSESYLKILINRRYKFERYEACTDFVNLLHELTDFSARAYATKIYTNHYAKEKFLPFPEVEPEINDEIDCGCDDHEKGC